MALDLGTFSKREGRPNPFIHSCQFLRKPKGRNHAAKAGLSQVKSVVVLLMGSKAL
jgi:hypothetical protein